jgi:hypothetical protein
MGWVIMGGIRQEVGDRVVVGVVGDVQVVRER